MLTIQRTQVRAKVADGNIGAAAEASDSVATRGFDLFYIEYDIDFGALTTEVMIDVELSHDDTTFFPECSGGTAVSKWKNTIAKASDPSEAAILSTVTGWLWVVPAEYLRLSAYATLGNGADSPADLWIVLIDNHTQIG